MYTYMHVSRETQYNDGFVLNPQTGFDFRGNSKMQMLETIFDSEFFAGLERLAADGLSWQGSHHLFNGYNSGKFSFNTWLLEMYVERERQASHREKPSRFQSAFAWQDMAAAVRFMKKYGAGTVYAVEPLSDTAILDMNLLKAETAANYWGGKLHPEDGYVPEYEVVMKLPVKVLEKI